MTVYTYESEFQHPRSSKAVAANTLQCWSSLWTWIPMEDYPHFQQSKKIVPTVPDKFDLYICIPPRKPLLGVQSVWYFHRGAKNGGRELKWPYPCKPPKTLVWGRTHSVFCQCLLCILRDLLLSMQGKCTLGRLLVDICGRMDLRSRYLCRVHNFQTYKTHLII